MPIFYILYMFHNTVSLSLSLCLPHLYPLHTSKYIHKCGTTITTIEFQNFPATLKANPAPVKRSLLGVLSCW